MAREKKELTPEQIKQIETMSGVGLNVSQMAAILGMSKKTFERRMQDTPGAIDALKKGRAIATQAVTATAYRMAVSGKTPAMTMFWLKCRARWREVNRFEHSGPGGKPIETKDVTRELTDEQLDAKIDALLAKQKPKGAG